MAALVGLLTLCNRLVVGLAKGDLDRIEANERGAPKDGWVWDEFQIARPFELPGEFERFLIRHE